MLHLYCLVPQQGITLILFLFLTSHSLLSITHKFGAFINNQRPSRGHIL